MNFTAIGKRFPKRDAVDKATGEVQYTVDLKMPGMIHGQILRSPHPYAHIKAIDTSGAEKLDGVLCVITAKDVPMRKFSFFDQGLFLFPPMSPLQHIHACEQITR